MTHQKSVIIVLTNTRQLTKSSNTPISRQELNNTGFDIRELAYLIKYLEHNRLHERLIFCSPRGGPAPVDKMSYEEGQKDGTVQEFIKNEQYRRMYEQTKSIDEVMKSDVIQTGRCGLVLIGGLGSLIDFPSSASLMHAIERAWEKKNVVMGVCSEAVAALSKVQQGSWIKGKRVTGTTNEELDQKNLRDEVPFSVQEVLERAGAEFKVQKPFQSHVEIEEERLITSQNAASANDFASQFAKLLQSA